MTLRETMRAACPRKTLDVAALGGSVELVGLTAGDMTAVLKGPDGAAGNALFLSLSLYRDGNRIVPAGQESDLLDLPHDVFTDLVLQASELNGLGKRAAPGNSAATTADGSTSG